MGAFEDAQKSAMDAMAAAGVKMPAGGLADMQNMAMPDPAYVAMVNKVNKTGIEAPAELGAIRAVGSPDISGATQHEFDVTIRPAGGEPYETTIKQSMLPTQIQGLAEGKAVTVKYDPDDPKAALLYGW